MKIKITESQLQKLRKVISEANTAIDDLNNIIDPSDFTVNEDFTVVTFRNVILEGDMEDNDISVRVMIDKILYTYYGEQDVTSFAMTWAIKDVYSGEDFSLGHVINNRVADVMNAKYSKYIGVTVSEFDVIIE
ncbi:hypothetical protein N9H63_01425 [bacterium]|nr:hypothetical protein [bacterium]